MSMFSTLEEAIDNAREEFLANNPDLDDDEVSVGQFNLQKYVMQDGEIMWQAEFLADESDDGELSPIRTGEAAQAILTAISMKLSCVRSGCRRTRCTNGMKANFSLNHRWILKKAKRWRRSGKTAAAITNPTAGNRRAAVDYS